MHSHARVYTHTHLEKIRFRRLHSSFPHSEASVEYLLRVTKLPTTDMLFNKWKEGTSTNNQSSKEGRRDKPAVIGPRGASKAHPKLISLSLLWSARWWRNEEGRVMRREGGEWKIELIRKLASAL